MNTSVNMQDLIINESVKTSIQILLNNYIVPKLKLINSQRKKENKIIESSFSSEFEEYLIRSYNKYSIINSIVLRNNQQKISEIYIPLTLEDAESIHREKKDILHKVSEYHNSFFEKYNKILITDTAGMGKSTLLKWLLLDIIKKGEKIPVIIELRKLTDKNTLLDEIIKELNPINSQVDKEFILDLINRGDFIFLLDGFDEIPFDYKISVTNDLQEFIWKANNNLFVISSRPEPETSGFIGFKEFHIQPLELEEAYTLLRKYGKNHEKVETLIKTIQDHRTLGQIGDFLKNPLMVSLLFKGYEYKPLIPNKKHIFYYNVYNALFDEHDLTKGGSYIHEKKSNLDIEQFHSILRKLGYLSLKQNTIEFDKATLLGLIEQSKTNCYDVNFKNIHFLHDLYLTVPIFVKEGNLYKWSHKSFMEYFAAQYIYKDTGEHKNTILQAICRSKKISTYNNLLDIYYDIDLQGFEENFVVKQVREFLLFCESNKKIKIEILEHLYLRTFYFLMDNKNDPFDELVKQGNVYVTMQHMKGLVSLTASSNPLYLITSDILDYKKHFIIKNNLHTITKMDSIIKKVFKELKLTTTDTLEFSHSFDFNKYPNIMNLILPLLDSNMIPRFSYEKCKQFIERFDAIPKNTNDDLITGL
jgi:predicted NACHT family NTPase